MLSGRGWKRRFRRKNYFDNTRFTVTSSLAYFNSISSDFLCLLGSSEVEEQQVFAAIGQAGFERLIAAFYSQIPSDDILVPMYPAHDLEGAKQRLRDFLIGRFGGPQIYVEQRGHPRLRIRHAPFAIGQTARDRWLQLMTRAL